MSSETVNNIIQKDLSALTHASATDIGKRREENQDSFGIIENPGLKCFMVADGMGGVKGGAIASNVAVEHLRKVLSGQNETNEDSIISAVQNANAEIFEKGSADPTLAGMGTTFVALIFVGLRLYVVNVGDSRAYRFRKDRLAQLSEDHTLVRELLKSGAITRGQAENHPVSHMLTRSLGPTPTVQVDCVLCHDGPARDDIYLLCSDGLYNLINERELIEILKDNSLEDSCKKLVDLANQRGGTDNITVILVRVGSEYPVSPDEFVDERDSVGLDDTAELTAEDIEPLEAAEKKSAAEAEASADSPKIEVGVNLGSVQGAPEMNGHGSTHTAEATVHPESAIKIKRSIFSLKQPEFWLVVLIALASGYWAGDFFGGDPQQKAWMDLDPSKYKLTEENNEILAPKVLDAEIAPITSEILDPAPDIGEPFENQPVLLSDLAERSFDQLDPTDEVYNGLNLQQVRDITQRKIDLAKFLQSIDDKLSALESSNGAKVQDTLKQTIKNVENVKSQIENVKQDIDSNTRKLAVWYGRRKRLQAGDPVNLASEVSLSSPVVKEKKEIFERATWAYLQEAEVLRYNPGDRKQEEKVGNLLKLRRKRMSELSDSVKEAIEKEVSAVDSKIVELTVEKGRLESLLNNAEQEKKYVQVMAGKDSKAKQVVKQELIRQRQIHSSELSELDQLVPKEHESH